MNLVFPESRPRHSSETSKGVKLKSATISIPATVMLCVSFAAMYLKGVDIDAVSSRVNLAA